MTIAAIAGTATVDEISERDPDLVSAGGSRTWSVCGRNFVVAVTELEAGDRLTEHDLPDEYALLVQDDAVVGVEHDGQAPVSVSEPAFVVVPAGTSTARGVVDHGDAGVHRSLRGRGHVLVSPQAARHHQHRTRRVPAGRRTARVRPAGEPPRGNTRRPAHPTDPDHPARRQPPPRKPTTDGHHPSRNPPHPHRRGRPLRRTGRARGHTRTRRIPPRTNRTDQPPTRRSIPPNRRRLRPRLNLRNQPRRVPHRLDPTTHREPPVDRRLPRHRRQTHLIRTAAVGESVRHAVRQNRLRRQPGSEPRTPAEAEAADRDPLRNEALVGESPEHSAEDAALSEMASVSFFTLVLGMRARHPASKLARAPWVGGRRWVALGVGLIAVLRRGTTGHHTPTTAVRRSAPRAREDDDMLDQCRRMSALRPVRHD